VGGEVGSAAGVDGDAEARAAAGSGDGGREAARRRGVVGCGSCRTGSSSASGAAMEREAELLPVWDLNGNEDSSKVTCLEVMTRLVSRS
jgi:hypothetical protein